MFIGASFIAAAPALAQRPSAPGKPAKPVSKVATLTTTGTPRTLDQALATVYMNQPALQAERAKLRATDENVPQAMAGWKPTIIVAGSAGYGDGVSRQFLEQDDAWLKNRTQRQIGTVQATASPAPSTPMSA